MNLWGTQISVFGRVLMPLPLSLPLACPQPLQIIPEEGSRAGPAGAEPTLQPDRPQAWGVGVGVGLASSGPQA